jgi:hypothetical protein
MQAGSEGASSSPVPEVEEGFATEGWKAERLKGSKSPPFPFFQPSSLSAFNLHRQLDFWCKPLHPFLLHPSYFILSMCPFHRPLGELALPLDTQL